MRPTLQPEMVEEIAAALPKKERMALQAQPLTREGLTELIALCKKRMQRDVWVGLVWFAAYGVLLVRTGTSWLTIGVFVAGAAYFTFTLFTSGSYGLNRKRVRVYEKLLEKI